MSSTGLKAPSKIARPGLVPPKPVSTGIAKPALATSSTYSISSSTTTNLNPNGEDLLNTSQEILLNEFKVNDRVFVNGTKSGVVAFIGETQFKEGIWAGVILDTADGKNNGSLNGVCYFQTEENRGVFCKLNKLSKIQTAVDLNETQQSAVSTTNLRVGDRVVINNSGGGFKVGVLRYVGTTDFAKGEWAGVELDEKLGKNDGSVGEKRYFQCEPLHGVFAPLQKVQLYTEEPAKQASSKLTTVNSSTKLIKPVSKLNTPSVKPASSTVGLNKSKMSKQLSGSQESLNSEKSSIYSTASAALAKTGLAQRRSLAKTTANTPASVLPTSASTNTNTTTTTGASSAGLAKKPPSQTVTLQSLKEKEGHINQLLKERDFERAEFTRAAQKFEQTESRLAEYIKLLEEKNDEIVRLNQVIGQLNENKTQLIAQCESDKTKIEDLEFQIEEHKLGCVSATNEEAASNSPRLTSTNQTSSCSANTPDEENIILKQLELQKEISKNHLEEIKFLKEQLDTLNIEVKQLRLGEEVYLKEKQDLTKNLDEIENQLTLAKKEAQENVQLRDKLKSLETDLESKVKNDQTTIEKLKADLNELNNKLQISENQKSELEFVYEEANAKCAELTSKLENASQNSQNDEKHAEIEFALEEHKVLVQDLEAKLNDLNEQTKQKKEQVEKLEKEIDNLKQLSAKVEQDNLELQNAKTELKAELEKKIEELNTNLAKQTADSSELNQKLSEQEALAQSLKTEFDNFKNEKEKEVNELKQLNETQIANLKQLQEKQLLSEQQVEESKKANSELQVRISEMIQNSGDNSAQLTSLNEKLKEKEKSIEEYQLNLANLQQEVGNLKEEKVITQKCLEDLHNNIAESLVIHETKIKEFEEKNQELIKRQEELNSTIANLNNQLNEKELVLKSKDENLEKLQTEISNLNEKLNESSQKFNDIELKYQNLIKEIEVLGTELKKEKELNQDKSESNESNEKLIESLKAEIQGSNEKFEAFKKENEALNTELKEKLKKAELKLEEEKEKHANLLSESEQKLNQEKETLVKETKSLKETLEGLRLKLESLTQEKEKLVSERDSAFADKQNLNQQNEKLSDEISKLNTELMTARNDSSASDLINQLKQELEETNQKIAKFEDNDKQSKEEYESTIKDLKDIIQENEDANEIRLTELNELKAKFEAYEMEVNSQREIIEYMESENEQLKAEIDLLKQQNKSDQVTSDLVGDEAKKPKYKLASEVRPAPRLYCDICDLFDLHETEDCPQQSMPHNNAQEELETHSKYNAPKASNRAYCDLCESFGHDETECKNVTNPLDKQHASDEEF